MIVDALITSCNDEDVIYFNSCDYYLMNKENLEVVVLDL